MQSAVTGPEGSTGTAGPDRFLHSDPHDFAGLYIRHRSSFTQHARGYLNDVRDADEVVQDAFLRLFLALPELDTELQALAYCRRTITNLCIDRYRATQRRPRLLELENLPDLSVSDDDDPSDQVVRAEDAAIVRTALSQLSPLHRAALIKREIEEKTVPVIAVELAIPQESVKHVLFRARRSLRRLLVGTSVAPDAGHESGSLLRPGAVVRKTVRDGGRVAALVAGLALAAGLSAGPDLRMVPVVGDNLPDLPSLAQVTAPVGDALGRLGERVLPALRPRSAGPQSARPQSAGPPSAGRQSPPANAAPERPEPASSGTRSSLESLLGHSLPVASRPEGGPLLLPTGAVQAAPAAPTAPEEATSVPEQEPPSTVDAADAPAGDTPQPAVQVSPAPPDAPAPEPSPTTGPTSATALTPADAPTSTTASTPAIEPDPIPTQPPSDPTTEAPPPDPTTSTPRLTATSKEKSAR